MKPIYEPSGKAKEYGELAINIFTGCPHRCFYCFAPRVMHRFKEEFHTHVEPRPGIVQAVREQIEREHITGKLIHLCFTCDPYPTGNDTTATREIIKIIKDTGNHVQILTKGDGSRDFDLLDENDWYGITIDGSEKSNDYDWENRIAAFINAHDEKCKTWVSFEPVIDEEKVLDILAYILGERLADRVMIGKLNYYPSDIDWGEFGFRVQTICEAFNADYYIKESLRKEMIE